MPDKTLVFSATLYRHAWRWVLTIILGITGIVDLVLLWELLFDTPAIAAQGQSAALWSAPLLMLLLLCTCAAGYCLRRYHAKMDIRTKSYVTVRETEVIHHIQEPGMPRETEGKTKTAGGDAAKSEYECYLSFRITEVTDVRRDKRGGIKLQGAVERIYYNEFSWEESGGNVRSVINLKSYRIPAYYEDMESVITALENLMKSGRTQLPVI